MYSHTYTQKAFHLEAELKVLLHCINHCYSNIFSISLSRIGRLLSKILAKNGGFAAIFARSGSHQTKAVALNLPTLNKLKIDIVLKQGNLLYYAPY